MINKMKSLPLEGVRMLEFAGIGPAPFAAMLLADMGAEIIRIDRPGGADPWTKRIIRRNRRSVIANLKDPADLARREAAGHGGGWPDRRVSSRRDGAARPRPGSVAGGQSAPRLWPHDRLGAGWPLAPTAGHDITYIALTGALAAIGPAERPVPPLNLVGDLGGGALYLAMGMLAALIQSRATGEGQVVDCAISDCTISLMGMFSISRIKAAGTSARGKPTFSMAPRRSTATMPVRMEVRRRRRARAGFLRRVMPGAGPSGFVGGGAHECDALAGADGAVCRCFCHRSRDEWAAHFAATDACVAPVLTLAEAPAHPHKPGARGICHGKWRGSAGPGAALSGSASALPALPEDFPDLAAACARWA